MEPRTHRRRSERGAAIAEFALVVPIFVVMLMGIVDFANAFNDANSVRQGVREGARQLVVADWDHDGCSGTSAQRVACVTRARIGLDPADVRVRIELGGAYEAGGQATVCAMYRASSITGMFGPVLDQQRFTSRITMRIEEIDDVSPLAAYSEAAFAGSDWNWC